MERPPALFMPYPLDEQLDQLPSDYGKIARRLLRAARWTRGSVGGFELDAGEALMDERSEKLWGALALDRDLKPSGRRALIRRVLERLEREGLISLRDARTGRPRGSAQTGGPATSPGSGPRNGPSPTVVRFLKFREILWTASAGTAQGTAQVSAQETARRNGPILLVDPPEPPELRLVAEASASYDSEPFERVAEVWNRTCVPAGFAKARSTPQQRRAARTRMRESGWFEAFSAACSYVAQEPFYRGGSASGWVLTLGWLLKPGNAEKTAERGATRKAPSVVAVPVQRPSGSLPAMASTAFTGGAGGFGA
jgi:hypothetical protein